MIFCNSIHRWEWEKRGVSNKLYRVFIRKEIGEHRVSVITRKHYRFTSNGIRASDHDHGELDESKIRLDETMNRIDESFDRLQGDLKKIIEDGIKQLFNLLIRERER